MSLPRLCHDSAALCFHVLRSEELGIVYQSVLQELESRRIQLPPPLDSCSPTPEFLQHLSSTEVDIHSSDSSSSSVAGGFARGIDFLQLLLPSSPPPAPRTPTVQPIKAFASNYGEDLASTVGSFSMGHMPGSDVVRIL